ncbi:MAG: HXXEE domain-containing protein [Candidatus Thorarchaeota archaeon]
MKFAHPLVAFLVILTSLSVGVGLIYPTTVAALTYSSGVYLILCFAMAGHFLEERYTRAWEIEAEVRASVEGTPEQMKEKRDFLVAFSHVFVLLSFLFYFPIASGEPWGMIYGIGAALNGILNGVAHTAILVKFKKNTGFVSGLVLLVIGLLLLISISIPLGI